MSITEINEETSAATRALLELARRDPRRRAHVARDIEALERVRVERCVEALQHNRLHVVWAAA